MADRAQEAFQYFVGKGWTPAQASGIVGHGIAESNLNPAAVGDSGAALGGWQWNDRRPALVAFAKSSGRSPTDFGAQLDFAQHELETSERYAADQLRAAKSPEQAAAAFMHFERPSGYTRDNPTGGHNWSGRRDNATSVFQKFASYPGVDAGPIPASRVTADPSTAPVSWSNPVQPRTPVTDTEINQQKAQANPYGLAEGAWEATKDAQTVGWLFGHRTDLMPDANWKPNMEELKAAQQGVPEQYHSQLGSAFSSGHLGQIKDNIMADVEREKRFADMGWTGVGLRLGASFTDIPGLALTALAPEIGLPAKSAMLARVAMRAAEGAVINVGLEVPRVINKPTAHASDLLWAAGTGLAMGGAFGAIARNPAVAEEAQQLVGIGKSIRTQAEHEMAGTQPMQLTVHPEGFEGSATVSPGGSVGAAATSQRERLTANAEDWTHSAVDEAIDRSAASAVRWDLAGKGKASDNPVTRAFTNGTVTDVVGNKNKAHIIETTAEEWQKQLHFDFQDAALKGHVKGLSSFMEERGMTAAQKPAADTEFRRLVTDYIDNVRPEREWDPSVKSTGDAQRKLYADYLEYAQSPGMLDGSTRRAVKGFENLEKDPNYRPNISDHEKIDWHSTTFGDDTMREAVAKAFMAKSPGLSEKVAGKIGKGYWRSMREAVAGMTNLDRVLHSNDMEALKKALTDLDLTAEEAQHVVSVVTPKPTEGGGIARSKKRGAYDNNFVVNLVDKAGNTHEFRMRDLFQDDYLANFQSYNRQMSGQIGMSMVRVKNPLHDPELHPDVPEHLIDGITGRGDLENLVRDMRATWDAKTELPLDKRKASADRDEKRMRFMYDRVTGVPDAFDSSGTGRALRAVLGYNYTRVMNQVGLAQLGEMMGVTTQFGIKAAMEGMPTLKAMLRDAKTGELHSGFAREIEQLSGFGDDFFRDGFRHTEDSAGNLINRSQSSKNWNRVEDTLHAGKRITNVISLMGPVDSYSRRWASASAVMSLVNAAGKSEPGKIVGLNMERMRALGVDDTMAERIFDQIRTHGTFEKNDVSGRSYRQGNFGKWDDQEAFSHFRTAVWRWSRLAIQENHLGQGSILLSSPMGRIIGQFRSFMLGAWTTQFLRNTHIRDFSGFATMAATSIFGTAVYTGQTYLNSIGRSDQHKYLEDRLSTKKIAAALVQRGSWSSFMPQAVDTGVQVAGFHPIFDTRSSGMSTSLLSNPVTDLADSAIKGVKGVSRAVREGGYSQGEARSLNRTLPFSNAMGWTNLLNAMISHQPERTPRAP